MNLLKNDLVVKLLKFIVAFGLIGWMIHKGLIDFSVLSLMAKPHYIAMALFLGFLNLGISNWRWTILLQARGFDVGMARTMPLTLIADFFNFAIPGAIGGDVVKAYYIAQDNPSRKMDAVTSVVVDRIFGLYSMVILALVAIVINIGFVLSKPELVFVALTSSGVFTVMSVFLAASLSKRIRVFLKMDMILEKLPGGQVGKRFYEAIHSYRDHGRTLFYSMVLSFVAQLVAVGFMVFVGYVIGETSLSFATFLFAVPLGFIVSAVPIAPAGIGVGQFAFLALFRMFSGTETDLGQISITVFQVTLFLWGLVGGFFYLKRKKPNLQEVEA